LVLALTLAGLAYWQRGVAVEQRTIAQQNEAQAKTERDNAERNFRLAQKTADSLVMDIARGLRDVQGMSADSVRTILDTAKGTLEQLAASSADDLSLQRSRAVMMEAFGEEFLGGEWKDRRRAQGARQARPGAHRLPRSPCGFQGIGRSKQKQHHMAARCGSALQ
jgi:hypothetical protein